MFTNVKDVYREIEQDGTVFGGAQVVDQKTAIMKRK